MTHMFVSLVAADMIADNMTMSRHGYGQWDNMGRPVSSPVSGMTVIVTLLVIAGVIIAFIFFIRKFA